MPKLDPETAVLITEMLFELCTEIDLHYDDNEFKLEWPIMTVIRRAGATLVASGHTPPDVFYHLERRFNAAQKRRS